MGLSADNVFGRWCKRLLKIGLAAAPYTGGLSEAWNQFDGAVFERDFQRLKDETNALKNQKSYSLCHAATEFAARSCKIGFTHGPGDRLFVTTGYGTFINKNTVLTSGVAYDLTMKVLKRRNGTASILTHLGISSFRLKERCKWGDHIVLMTEAQDTSHLKKYCKDTNYEKMIAMLKPLDTPARIRSVAFLGQEVGFFNAPENNASRRSPGDFQLETARVSFRMRCTQSTFAESALTPIISRVEVTGSGIFTADGFLVGVLQDILIVKDEMGRRPIIANFLGAKRLGGLSVEI